MTAILASGIPVTRTTGGKGHRTKKAQRAAQKATTTVRVRPVSKRAAAPQEDWL